MIKNNLLEDTYRSPQDVIQRGLNAQVLRDSDVFKVAVNEMYNRLTLSEDMLLGSPSDNEENLMAQVKRYAMMRCLLSDFITTIDGFMFDAENEKAAAEIDPTRGT